MLDMFLAQVIIFSVIGLIITIIGINHLVDWTIGYENYLKNGSEKEDYI